jgi:hypothetical protein
MNPYPMRTPDEARVSMQRAVDDRSALRITADEFKGIKELFNRRLMQVKKHALLSSAAKFRTRQK